VCTPRMSANTEPLFLRLYERLLTDYSRWTSPRTRRVFEGAVLVIALVLLATVVALHVAEDNEVTHMEAVFPHRFSCSPDVSHRRCSSRTGRWTVKMCCTSRCTAGRTTTLQS